MKEHNLHDNAATGPNGEERKWEYRPPRTPNEVARQQQLISSLCLQGWTQAQIAQKLNLSEATVSRDMVKLREEWKSEVAFSMHELREREAAKLTHAELRLNAIANKPEATDRNKIAALETARRIVDSRSELLGIKQSADAIQQRAAQIEMQRRCVRVFNEACALFVPDPATVRKIAEYLRANDPAGELPSGDMEQKQLPPPDPAQWGGRSGIKPFMLRPKHKKLALPQPIADRTMVKQ